MDQYDKGACSSQCHTEADAVGIDILQVRSHGAFLTEWAPIITEDDARIISTHQKKPAYNLAQLPVLAHRDISLRC
jgi:hypothetical protein